MSAAQKEMCAMSFDPYNYSTVIRQQELTRAELLRADAQAARIADWVWCLGRAAAQAGHILRQAVSLGATMQPRRTR